MSSIETVLKPVYLKHHDGDYRIYSCECTDESILKDHRGNVSVLGVMPRFDLGVEYKAEIELAQIHEKWGASYKYIAMYQDIPDTPEGQKEYLATLMTELQLNEVYKVYSEEDNIIDLIKDKDFDWKKVKGFGEVVFERIHQKVIETLEYKEILSKFGKYGITYEVILKLAEELKGSRQLAIQKLEDNPYILCEYVSGWGFKRTDIVAKKMGVKHDSPHRIHTGIKYTIEENQNQGHTYMVRKDLLVSACDILQLDKEIIEKELENTDGLKVIDDKIALQRTYNAEVYIAEKLKELLANNVELDFDVDEFIEKIEKKHSIELTHQQKDFFRMVKENRVGILTGYAGCVDSETEYFNGERWVSLSQYKYGDKVLQYNEDGSSTLVDPIDYHRLKSTEMTLMKNKSGSINQCLSSDHTVVYRTSKGHLSKLPFHEVERRNINNSAGFNGRFITTFEYLDGCGLRLSDYELKLMVAVIADGTYVNRTGNKVRINLKKARKKERLLNIIVKLGLDCRIKHREDGYSEYHFIAPMRTKVFDSVWYSCNNEQLKIICDEVLHWDGTIYENGRRSFSSCEKESIDFIQFAFTSQGYRTSIRIDDRIGQKYKDGGKYIRKRLSYQLCITQNKNSSVSFIARTPDKKTTFEKTLSKDGYMYCFTVPSGMWIMRRDGRIAVTGNCGKSFMQKLVVEMLEELKKTYLLLSPTGKAAKLLSSYTGRKAKTIHRVIGYGMRKEAQELIEITEDIIIVDEMSMTDCFVLKSLLTKIKNPHARILFCGDPAQLAAVGAANLLHDFIESGMIPTSKLDIVFRQKEGGLLDVITKVRNGEKLVPNDFTGKKVFGKDFIIHCVPQSEIPRGYQHYYNYFLQISSPENITIISPTRKGIAGTIAINSYIQSIVNTSSDEKIEYPFGEDIIFRVGDYVINTQNMYEILDYNDNIIDVVNGDTGVIVDIVKDKKQDKEKESSETPKERDKNGIVIKFDNGLVRFDFSLVGQLLHAWSMTGHRMQGSAADNTVSIADKAHTFQLSRNQLYTMLSRTKGKGVFLTQADVFNRALKIVDNMRRNTFMQELLKEN